MVRLIATVLMSERSGEPFSIGWFVPRRFRLNHTLFVTWNREFSRGFCDLIVL
jgi:hypothetical protein